MAIRSFLDIILKWPQKMKMSLVFVSRGHETKQDSDPFSVD